jgi:hypothetical protein
MNPAIGCCLGNNEATLHQFVQSGFDLTNCISNPLFRQPPRHYSFHGIVSVFMATEVFQNLVSNQNAAFMCGVIHAIAISNQLLALQASIADASRKISVFVRFPKAWEAIIVRPADELLGNCAGIRGEAKGGHFYPR